MRILVTYASKRGGTEGLAGWIADELRRRGATVDLCRVEEAFDLLAWDAIVIGGALYMGHWHPDAAHFVIHNASSLRLRPVWLFSSGPLDDSADRADVPPVDRVARLMTLVRARGHATFGGRLTPDAHGFIAQAMARTHAGDWRNEARVRAWADELLTSLEVERTVRGEGVVAVRPRA